MTEWTENRTALDYGAGILRGTKTCLRELRDDDLPALVGWMIDPTVAVFQAFVVRPQPSDAIAEQFRSWSANKDSTGAGFSIVARETDELIGHVTLWGASVAARAATLAIIIAPDHWGRGYGTDAVRVMVRYGFEEMGLNRIGLGVWAYNDRAIATYRKIGFVDEGRRRQVVFHAGRFHDEILMSLLSSEWSSPDH